MDRARAAFVVGAVVAAVPVAIYAGFTVDDALIPARYAHHIARGHGYVFNASGPVTDGVTPLGFPYLLAPFARSGPLAALSFARALGAALWVIAAGFLGAEIERAGGSRARYAAFLLVLCSAPLAAWSQAGLETGLVTALVTAGLCLRAGSARALAVGLAAALRPEVLPMAAVLAFPRGEDRRPKADGEDGAPKTVDRSITPAHFGRLALTALPFTLVAAIRLARFGELAPLSLYAKPPDALLGAQYALACFLVTGPIALVAPFALARVSPRARWLALAVLTHYVAVAVAGGDWMPLSRLVVPSIPVVVLAAAHLAGAADRAYTIGRFILAVAAEGTIFVRMHEASARVLDERTALIREVSPWLEGRRAIATVDVGWVGAATDSDVVDLAGVTDPFVAFLPGSHTTKRIPDSMIDARHVDTLVLLLKAGGEVGPTWQSAPFDRGVERYVALGPGMGDAFEVAFVSTGRLHYVVLTRSEQKVARAP